MSTTWGFETRQIHSGQEADPTTGSRAVPIYQTTAYQFRDTAHAANLFALGEPGNIYTRIMNPTQAVLETRLAALENGLSETAAGVPGALAVASGQAAETIAIMNIVEAGGHIVAGAALYGGTYNLLHHTLPKYGIETTFVDDADNLDAWRAAVRPNTKLFYGESIGNPKNNVFDIAGIGSVAKDIGVPLVIDNTVASPYLINPLDHGADIVVHSATKFIGGHGTSVAGLIVDGGSFDFGDADKYPNYNNPDPSYHGLTYWPTLGHGAFIAKARVQLLRDFGSAISPFNAFQILQGLETLSLRMERHVQNAQTVAEWLEAQPQVDSVNYAGLESSPSHEMAKKYTNSKGYGSVPSFNIEGGVEAGQKFVEGLELHSHVANIGDVRSLVIHPGSTTHSQLTPEEQATTGVNPSLVRLSVGLETVSDIIEDLEKGFAAASA